MHQGFSFGQSNNRIPHPKQFNIENQTMKTTSITVAGIRVSSLLMLIASALLTGCGAVSVSHVPKVSAIPPAKMSDLRGAQPLDVKSGGGSADETSFGTVGMGKVVGKPAEWTAAAVEAVRANLSARGATLTAGAPRSLTITMTEARVKTVPVVGGAKTRIVLTVSTPDGLNGTFEGADSSMAPLSSVNGAMTDAVKKLLMDPAVDAYVRK
jgi:hypothetical protein